TDALALGERIAVLESGRLTHYGPRDELLARPRSAYVADFLGVNLLHGKVEGPGASGVTWLGVGTARVAVPDAAEAGELFAVVNAREIALTRDAPEGSARNVFRGTIEELIPEPPAGERLRVLLATEPRLVAEITRSAAEA